MYITLAKNVKVFSVSVATLLAFGLTSMVAVAEQAPQPTPISLQASKVLPAAMLTGEGYKIDQNVSNDGFQNTYALTTDYGDFTVTGNGALHARIVEIQATKKLEEIESSDAFKDAVKDAAVGMVEGGKALVTSPVETSKGAVKGVGRWLGNIGRSVTSDDPNQDNALKTLLGHDAVKRGYAIGLGVDPNTDFEPFQERLGRVARAATAGGLVTSMGADAATSGTVAGTVVTVTSTAGMKDILMDEPPSTLARINREKLEEMGIPELNIDALLKNYNYTPMQMTLMVEALRRMGDIHGRDIFVAYATAAPDRLITRYLQESAEMLANYITKNETGKIVSIGGDAWFVTRSGKLIGAFPIDYLAWTAELAGDDKLASEGAAELGLKSKELLLEGQIDPVARKALESRGWKVQQNVKLASMVISK